MQNTKNNNQKTGSNSKQTGNSKTSGKDSGMQPGSMPHIPSAREKAKDMDSKEGPMQRAMSFNN